MISSKLGRSVSRSSRAREYATIASMRLQFLATAKRRPDQFTVIVRNVPPDPDKSISELVEQFFSVNHPDYYLTHQLIYNANKLAKLVKQKQKMQNWLDYYNLKYARNKSTKPVIKTGCLGLWGDEVDGIDFHTSEIERLSTKAVITMVQQAMQYIDETPDTDTKVELIKTLNSVTAGKIYVEIERSRLVKKLAKIKEEVR